MSLNRRTLEATLVVLIATASILNSLAARQAEASLVSSILSKFGQSSTQATFASNGGRSLRISKLNNLDNEIRSYGDNNNNDSTRDLTKVDCHPLSGASKQNCETLGCVWEPVSAESAYFVDKDNNSKTKNENDKQQLNFDWTKVHYIKEGDEPASQVKEPWCYMPEDFVGYKVKSKKASGDSLEILLERTRPSGLPDDIEHVKVSAVSLNGGKVLRVKFEDADNERFEPEIPKLNFTKDTEISDCANAGPKIEAKVLSTNRLVLYRDDTNAVLFDVHLSKLIFADQFIQLNSKLASPTVHGLGEHFDSFTKSSNSYKVYTMFNKDKVPLPLGRRSYGTFPVYFSLDSNDTKAHAVYLKNSNAMDIVLQSDQSITYRTIGGILDFYVFVGNEPYGVVGDFQRAVGLPPLPPRWALGFHLSRWGYNSTSETERVWQATRDAKIPFDVQWNDIDYMDKHNDFTYDKKNFAKLPELVKKIHDANMRYVPLFDPGVSQEQNQYLPYSLGVELDVFMKNITNQIIVGQVWNDSNRTVFPDFSHPNAQKYWSTLFKQFYGQIEFDGAWIDMNDISSFVDGSLTGCPWNNKLESPPYSPGGFKLATKTMCMTAKNYAGSQYNLHNLYAFYEAIATYNALNDTQPGKRPFVLSRSTTVGMNKYASHWSGDVLSNWDYLRWTIPSLLEHSMYGYALIGSDICGFSQDTNVELCSRWSTLGAFYSFSRNHNEMETIAQDPVALGPQVVAANFNAQTKRYSLLPYLYSLMHRAHRYGEPFARSLAMEFFSDVEARNVEEQFLVGRALMVAPIVHEGKNFKRVYLPAGKWYKGDIMPNVSHESAPQVYQAESGQEVVVNNIGLDNLALFYRGGFILPIYPKPAQTTVDIVKQPLGLEAYLNQDGHAAGEVFLDDGETDDSSKFDRVHFEIEQNSNKLTLKLTNSSWMGQAKFGLIKLFGLPSRKKITKVTENGVEIADFRQVGHTLSFMLRNGQVLRQKNPTLAVEWFN